MNWIKVAVACAAVVLIAVSSGQAMPNPPAALSVDVERQGSGASAVAIYRLRVTADADGAAFGLSYRLPGWPTHEPVGGAPLNIQSVRLLGPGSIRPARPLLVVKPSLKRKPECQRYSAPLSQRFWVEVPAAASAVVEIRARATYPLWPGTRQELSITTFESENLWTPETVLWSGSAPVVGARGVHIQMRERAWQDPRSEATPEFVGSTDPPLRFEPVFLRVVRLSKSGGVDLGSWAQPSAVPMGSTITDARGHFRVPSEKLSRAGSLSIQARVKGSQQLAADWNCSPFFRLRTARPGG